MKNYLTSVLISTSIMVNALLGGKPYQTLSARVYDKDIKWLEFLIDRAFIYLTLTEDHCYNSWLIWQGADKARWEVLEK